MFKKSVCVATILAGLFATSLHAQTFELLHSFATDNSEGSVTMATLTEGPEGDLYGTTTAGGATGDGTIFKITTDGTFTLLDSFHATTTGKNPQGRLLNIGDGNLYGVTFINDSLPGSPSGTTYQFTPGSGLSALFPLPTGANNPAKGVALTTGESNVLQVLCYDFAGIWRVPLDGSTRTVSFINKNGFKARSIIRGRDGYLYGTSEAGGSNGLGTIFRLDPDGSNLTIIHECTTATAPTDGKIPLGAMVQGMDGTLYGTMSDGGPHNGVLFRITQAGEYQVLHTFSDLRYPKGDLVIATDGMIYGTAENGTFGSGGIFRINPSGTGYKVLFQFSNPNTMPFYPQGRAPLGGLVQGSDGNLYGTTTSGGDFGKGTIFRLKIKLPLPIENRTPVALNDYIHIDGDSVVANVKANDFDADGDPLTLRITQGPGSGTAVLQPDGTILYTKGGSFSNVDNFKYEISDGRGGVTEATAYITESPAIHVDQTLSLTGLLASPGTSMAGTGIPRAQMAVKLLPTGKFTGTIITKRKRIPFKGTLPLDTLATSVKVKLPVLGSATLFLGLEISEIGGDLRAALFSNTETWDGALLPNSAPSSTPESNVKQSYTLRLDPDGGNPALPLGDGYGAMKVMPTGAVTVAGKLGDGTPFSWSSSLVGAPALFIGLPVFSEPYVGGAIGGFLLRGANLGDPFNGQVTWIRPQGKNLTKPYGAGFSGQADVHATRFIPPTGVAPVLSIPSGAVSLGGAGPVPNVVTGTFTISGKKITVAAPLKQLTINRATGVFTGKMLVDNKALSFSGTVDQAGNAGAGFASVGGITVLVVLGP